MVQVSREFSLLAVASLRQNRTSFSGPFPLLLGFSVSNSNHFRETQDLHGISSSVLWFPVGTMPQANLHPIV